MSLAAIAVVLGWALAASSALAAPKYVDRVVGTAASGSTGGLFNVPSGVAVNATGAGGVAAGTFYVSDAINNRVQRFSSAGVFERAWGANVVTAATNEVQRLTVAATAGSYTLSFGGATTGPLQWNAPASSGAGNLQAALRALLSIGNSNVTVTGGPGNAAGSAPYVITFTGAAAGANVAQITANTGSLTGTATPATTTEGSGAFEVCVSAASCRAGVGVFPNSGNADKNGALGGPQGIAVDGDTGNVYVANRDGRGVYVYDAGGAFLRAFGFDVVASGPGNTGTGYEVCVQANGDTCKQGVAGSGVGQLNPSGVNRNFDVVVSPPDGNPSAGSVYLADGDNRRVNVYDLDGTSPSSIGSSVDFALSYPRDLAIGSGVLYASDFANGNEVKRYDVTAGSFLTPLNVAAIPTDGVTSNQGTTGLDVDTDTGNLLVARGNAAAGVIEIGSPSGAAPTFVDRHLTAVNPANVAANPVTDEILELVNHRVLILNAGASVPDVTLDGATDVGATTATLNATIDSTSGGLPTVYQLQVSLNGVAWTTLVSGTVAGGASQAVSGVATDLLPNTLYRVRVVASRTLGNPEVTSTETTFLTDGVAPTIVSIATDGVSMTSARLYGYVNPNSSQTTYRFEWGTTPGSYPNRVPLPNAALGAGPKPVLAAQELEGLAPATTYYFRLVAASATQGVTTSPAQTFATRSGPVSTRATELVSPADKGPTGTVGFFTLFPAGGLRTGEDGEGVMYQLGSGTPDATAPGTLAYVARRGPAGWVSEQRTPALTQETQPNSVSRSGGIELFTASDLGCGVVQSPQTLTPDTPDVMREVGANSLYTRGADGSYELLTTLLPSNLTDAVVRASLTNLTVVYTVFGASPDCGRVVFRSWNGFRYPGLNGSGLYESDHGTMRNVAVLPGGSDPAGSLPGNFRVGGQVASAVAGSGEGVNFGITSRAVSEDGARTYFTAFSNSGSDSGKPALFLRENGTTTKVSASKTATVNQQAYFQGASADGSKTVFMANYGLTPTSSTGPVATSCTNMPPQPCALYLYDVDTDELVDISATSDPANTNGASVDGIVAASDDMSRVYFAARGQLVAGRGSTYAENAARATANVYLWDDGTLRYVATIAATDEFEDPFSFPISVLARSRPGQVSEATPDGAHLLFQSRANVVGYDSGGVTELYRYSVDTNTTICISCRRDGEPSAGDRTAVPMQATEPNRQMSHDGRRVFFSSQDALAAGGVNGKDNIYLWDQGSVELITSGPKRAAVGSISEPVIVGASATGDDVFVRTTVGLDPSDTDGSYDLYDFRVGGGFPQTSVEVCDPLAGGCQGPAIGVPIAVQPRTTSSSGDGNVVSGERKTLRVGKPSKKARRRAARTGVIRLRIRSNKAGRVSAVAKGRVGKKMRRVGRASKRLSKPGVARVNLRLNSRARRALKAGRKLNLSIQVRSPGARSRSITVRLPGASS